MHSILSLPARVLLLCASGLSVAEVFTSVDDSIVTFTFNKPTKQNDGSHHAIRKRDLFLELPSSGNGALHTEIEQSPITLAPKDSCALIIAEPQITLKNNHWTDILHLESEFTPKTCLTYEDVNKAYRLARKRIDLKLPEIGNEWKPSEIESTARLSLEISYVLAKKFQMKPCEIAYLLPKVDVMRSALSEICPDFVRPMICSPGRYQRFDGLCNNVKYPSWGGTRTPFSKLRVPAYSDNLSSPRGGSHHIGLPSARKVSSRVHLTTRFIDASINTLFLSWGQFIDHDFGQQVTPSDPSKPGVDNCCGLPQHKKGEFCFEIDVATDDPFYSHFNKTCLPFHRAFPSQGQNCKLGFSKQMNLRTSVIDGDMIYGETVDKSNSLRLFHGGELKMVAYAQDLSLKPHLPLQVQHPDFQCRRPTKNVFCFLSGDVRANEQLLIAGLHIMFARFHNDIVRALYSVNNHWDDERLYYEGRHIVSAVLQRITYNEFIPLLIGERKMKEYDILLNKWGHWDGYDPKVNPSTLSEFVVAAFRFGHSLLPSAIEFWSLNRKHISSFPLRDVLQRPFALLVPYQMDLVVMGQLNQLAEAVDSSITEEVLNYLFVKEKNKFGADLAALNIQRSRDFGLHPFMTYREMCGLKVCKTWEECAYLGLFHNSTLHHLKDVYDSPLDIDLFPGGVSERPMPDALLGPTFGCISAIQFYLYRHGDRYWHELPNQPSSFTENQLQEIRRQIFSHVICSTTDHISQIQTWPFLLPDHETNPLINCNNDVIKFNPLPWREDRDELNTYILQ